MAGLNKVMLIGNLGRDPEIRHTPGGTAVTNFSIATSEQWNDRNTGERQERTEWHRIVVFGKQAEVCEKYLFKGSSIYIEGRLQTRSWEKEGQTHYTTEIIASNFQFLSRAGNQNSSGGHQNPGGGQAPNPDDFQGQTNSGMTGGPDAIPDDDIPF